MKLCIAVALSHKPKLLILDEATSGLDPIMRDDMLDVFLDFVQDENHSILMSSHITTDLEKVADYITFVHQGKVLFCKSKDELRYNYGIIRCGAALFAEIDQSEILACRKCDYQWDVLVADKEKARRKYKTAVVDDAFYAARFCPHFCPFQRTGSLYYREWSSMQHDGYDYVQL